MLQTVSIGGQVEEVDLHSGECLVAYAKGLAEGKQRAAWDDEHFRKREQEPTE
jgi:hypothetical protein